MRSLQWLQEKLFQKRCGLGVLLNDFKFQIHFLYFKYIFPGRPCYETIIIMIYRAVDKTERIVGV